MGRRIIWVMVIVAVAGLLTALLLSSCDNVILRDEVLARLTGPEIVIKQVGTMMDPGDTYDFGTPMYLDETFTIENIGLQTLRLTGTPIVQISGSDSDAFAIITQPPVDAIDPGDTADFVINFSDSGMSGTGQRTASVTIPNNDFDEGSFSFFVTGNDTFP